MDTSDSEYIKLDSAPRKPAPPAGCPSQQRYHHLPGYMHQNIGADFVSTLFILLHYLLDVLTTHLSLPPPWTLPCHLYPSSFPPVTYFLCTMPQVTWVPASSFWLPPSPPHGDAMAMIHTCVHPHPFPLHTSDGSSLCLARMG